MYKSRLLFLQDKHNTEELKNATALICDGPLKNKNGTKLHALLFDTVFILTRQLQKQTVMYQVSTEHDKWSLLWIQTFATYMQYKFFYIEHNSLCIQML